VVPALRSEFALDHPCARAAHAQATVRVIHVVLRLGLDRLVDIFSRRFVAHEQVHPRPPLSAVPRPGGLSSVLHFLFFVKKNLFFCSTNNFLTEQNLVRRRCQALMVEAPAAPSLAARVAELEALLDQEVASREYWERAHASLERRCSALARDADRLAKLLRSEVCRLPRARRCPAAACAARDCA